MEACNEYINTIGWRVSFDAGTDSLLWECTSTTGIPSLFYIHVDETSAYYPLFRRTGGFTGPLNMIVGD